MKPIARLAIVAALIVAPGLAALADDEHHPPSSSDTTQARPQQRGDAPAMGPGGMMGMMQQGGGGPGMSGMMGSDMTPMMNMMRMMGMMGEPGDSARMQGAAMGMRMQAMTEHVEGRIAFLRAELKITDAQSRDWNQFADALRANAKSHADVHGAAVRPDDPQPNLLQRLQQQEQLLAARQKAAQQIVLTLTPLYTAFSDEQKRLADRLVPPHIGMMPMARM